MSQQKQQVGEKAARDVGPDLSVLIIILMLWLS